MNGNPVPVDQDGRIPFRLRIGVTGHRRLPDTNQLLPLVREAIEQIGRLVPAQERTPVCLAVVSALAEGADRLVAGLVLNTVDAQLEAVLPLPVADYRTDFASESSQIEFDTLMGRATRVVELPAMDMREAAYEQAGRYVVERCDVLVAIWDGQPARGQGGTAGVVDWARDRRIPIFWIRTAPGLALIVEPGEGLDSDPLEALDRYNRAVVTRERFSRDLAAYGRQVTAQGQENGIDAEALAPFIRWLAPRYVRADLLASRYQQRFFMFSDAIFVLAALAVVASAGTELGHQIPFLVNSRIFSHLRPLPLVEFTAMVLVLFVLFMVRRRAFHHGWIHHRMLAERLRSAFFLALVSLDIKGERETEHVSLHQAAEGWLERAFDEIWTSRPVSNAVVPIERLRGFLSAAWIGDQARYQIRKSKRHEWNNRMITNVTVSIYLTTLVIAGLNAVSVVSSDAHDPPVWSTLALYLSVTLPAVASALGGIGAQREHRRNARRSGRMARYLGTLRARMDAAPDLPTVHAIARQASEVMVEDIDDWFVTMEFRDVELQG